MDQGKPSEGKAGAGGQSKDEKKAVAGSVAVLMMSLLLVGWVFFFLKKVARGEPVETAWGPQNDVLDFTNLKEATEQFSDVYFDTKTELQNIRDEAAVQEKNRIQREQAAQQSEYYDPNTQGGSSEAPSFGN